MDINAIQCHLVTSASWNRLSKDRDSSWTRTPHAKVRLRPNWRQSERPKIKLRSCTGLSTGLAHRIAQDTNINAKLSSIPNSHVNGFWIETAICTRKQRSSAAAQYDIEYHQSKAPANKPRIYVMKMNGVRKWSWSSYRRPQNESPQSWRACRVGPAGQQVRADSSGLPKSIPRMIRTSASKLKKITAEWPVKPPRRIIPKEKINGNTSKMWNKPTQIGRQQSNGCSLWTLPILGASWTAVSLISTWRWLTVRRDKGSDVAEGDMMISSSSLYVL